MKLDERSSTPYCGVQNVSTPGNGGSWERVENVVWSGATIAGPRDGKERVGGVIDPADLSQASTRPSRVTRKGGRLSFYLVFHHAPWGLEFFDRANDRIPTHSPFYPRTLRTCT